MLRDFPSFRLIVLFIAAGRDAFSTTFRADLTIPLASVKLNSDGVEPSILEYPPSTSFEFFSKCAFLGSFTFAFVVNGGLHKVS